MELHYPDIVIAGYAEDVETACAVLVQYPGTIHRADEKTVKMLDQWSGAIVVYIFSLDTGYSSQLKSLFIFIHDQLKPKDEMVLLREPGIGRLVFPELDLLPRCNLAMLRAQIDAIVDRL